MRSFAAALAVVTLVVYQTTHPVRCTHGHFETDNVPGHFDTTMIPLGDTLHPLRSYVPRHTRVHWECDE